MKTRPKFLLFVLLLALVSGVLFPLSAFAETDIPGGELPESWFDDAVFLGDSLTGSLASYCMVNDGLGGATILFMNGLSCRKLVMQKFEIGFKGKTYPPEAAIRESGASKVFLMLAMNDVGNPLDELKECWTEFLGRIRSECPDIDVYIQSGTPVLKDNLYFTKKNMDAYNEMLREFCEEQGCVYVDVTPGLEDEEGHLKEEFKMAYISDNVHMNFDGCEIWVKNLRNADNYSVPPEM